MGEQEFKRLAFNHFYGSIPGVYFTACQHQLFDRSIRREIKIGQIDPENIRIQGRFKKVHPVFLVGHRTPTRRSDIRLVGGRNPQRHRHIAHYAKYPGHRLALSTCLRNSLNVKRGSYKTVSRPVRSRQHH